MCAGLYRSEGRGEKGGQIGSRNERRGVERSERVGERCVKWVDKEGN